MIQPLSAISSIDLAREEAVRCELGAVARVWDATLKLYQTAVYPAISICVRHQGRIVLNRAVGHSSGNGPDDELEVAKKIVTPDTPFCIFSASKAITAMVVHLLDDRGLLHIDDRVAEYIPEFAQQGKEWVTIRHVLSHRSGIPSFAGDNNVQLLYRWDEVVQRLCETRPVSKAGRRLAYHAITGGFILGEIVRRVTGKDIRTVLAEEILSPLSFKGLNYGVPVDETENVAKSYFTGHRVPPVLRHVVRNALGVSFAEAARIGNEPAYLTTIVPSGNVVGTAEELSRFFQLLLDGGTQNGVRIFDPRTIRRAINETAYLEMDLTIGLPVRYGVGLMLGSERFSPFGPKTSNAYGHLGFINILGWADPDRQITVGLLTSGKPFVSSHLVRLFQLLRTIGVSFPVA